MSDSFSSSSEHRTSPGPESPPPSTDRLSDLLHRVALKDRDAFAQLYEATAAKLLGTVLRMLNNRGWAEDVVQDAYVKIWQKAQQFDAAKASPITWMVTIARHSAIDALRKQSAGRMAPQEELDYVPTAEPNAQSQLESEQALSRLHLCLDELEEARREMVRLAYLNGWSRADLAAHFDQPLNTVKTWLHRALKQLKGCLAP